MVGDVSIEAVHKIRNLGVIFDENLNMSEHITNICRTVNFHLHNLRNINKFLSKDARGILVHALIFSHLDYCNSLLYGLPTYQIARLQRVQNAAARFVCQVPKFDHIQHHLKTLHWLPVKYRILFKIAVLTYKAITNQAPAYLKDMIVHNTSRYQLRSSASITLKVPRSNHRTLGDRAFAVASPTVWNSLPATIRDLNALGTFKSHLQTHYFALAYL